MAFISGTSHHPRKCGRRNGPKFPTDTIRTKTYAPKFLEHALILTHDPIATRNWWRDALGLVEGDAPDFGFPVHWLHIGDQDVVHIAPAGGSAAQNAYLGDEADGPAMGSGRLDHNCFNCEGVEETFARLDAIGAKYEQRRAGTSPD